MDTNEIMSSKQSTIGDLYAIRAGLSYVSILSDRYRKNKKELEELEDAEGRLLILEGNIQDYKNEIKNLEIKNKDIKSQRRSKRVFEEMIDDHKGLMIQLPISLVLMVFSIVFSFMDDDNSAIVEIARVLFWPSIMWNIICLICSIACLVGAYGDVKCDEDSVGHALAKTRSDLSKAEQDYQSEKNDSISRTARKTVVKSAMEESRKQANSIYHALLDNYSYVCHPRDWENIDRILFYLSTGRAANYRDALNLMDRRLDAEMIANEVAACSEMICREIRSSTRYITGAIRSASETIAESNYLVASHLEESNAIGRKLVSEQELNNALQAKANRSMEELLNDYQVVNNRVKY